jgi:hypothetical protein
LEMIARSIDMRGDQYDQDALERDLSGLYGPDGLAAMVLHRYPVTPIIGRGGDVKRMLGWRKLARDRACPLVERASQRYRRNGSAKNSSIVRSV